MGIGGGVGEEGERDKSIVDIGILQKQYIQVQLLPFTCISMIINSFATSVIFSTSCNAFGERVVSQWSEIYIIP